MRCREAYNLHVCRWIQDQLVNHREDVWLDGVEDYMEHAKKLLMEAADSESPVSGLKENNSEAWSNGQKAEDRAAMNGKQPGSFGSFKVQGQRDKQDGLGQFAFPPFSVTSGISTVPHVCRLMRDASNIVLIDITLPPLII